MSARVAATIAVALLATSFTWVGASPALAATPEATVSPAAPMRAESFTISTRLTTRFARTARLQRLTGSTWRTVSSRSTSRAGSVSFTTSTPYSSTRLRVYAPAARNGSKRFPSQRTATRTVRTVDQRVTHVLSERPTDARLTMAVTATPARPGRAVKLQEQSGDGSWVTVSTGTIGSGGAARFDGVRTGLQADGRRYRANVSAARGASGAVSPPSTFRSTPLGVRLVAEPAADGTRILTASTTGVVDRVRFYVDGSEIGSDTTRPWSVPWTPARGEHDLVARAVGPNGTVLSSAVLADVPAGTVDETAGVPDGFSVETVQSGFDLPTTFAVADLDHVLVAEKSGLVKLFGRDEQGQATTPRIVLDLRDRVLQQEDRGLVGLAVDPRFASNGFIYVAYVLDDGSDGDRRAQAQQVVRYTMVDDEIDPATRHVVLGRVTGPSCYAVEAIETPDCLPLDGYTHTIGDLAFDDAGRLLVSVGDGALLTFAESETGRAQTMRAQNPQVLAGKVLRVDPVTGRGVPGNPFYGTPQDAAGLPGTSNASRVLALGFRNPFRISVRHAGNGDPDDDQVMVGDVGEGRTEEINSITDDSGVNFGWPCLEGTQPTDLPGLDAEDSPFHPCVAVRGASGDDAPVGPSHAYAHVGGASVTGGVTSTGDVYPPEYRGAYFFGDYAESFLRTAVVDHHGELEEVEPFATADAAGGPVKLVDAADGTIWFLSVYTGTLRRIAYSPEPQPGRCAVGTFAQTFHDLDGDDSTFDRDYAENGWWLPFAEATLPAEPVATGGCREGITLAPTLGSPWTDDDDREHPGDRFGVRWQGRVELSGGTYRFDVRGQEWVRLWVDGTQVYDWFDANEFWLDNGVDAPVARLDRGVHSIRVELVHREGEASAAVTWDRTGVPPSVVLDLPAAGAVVSRGQSVPFSATVSAGADVEVVAELLHHSGGDVHVHPYASRAAAAGTLTFDDEHAPGGSVFRVRAVATGPDGSTTRSAPAYVCLTGNRVGICGTS